VERIHRQLFALAAYIHQTRKEILDSWQQSVSEDPELTTSAAITHAQFTDSIPRVLDAFEEALQASDGVGLTRAELEQRAGASEHGLHRWQQGYDLRESLREWAHLHRCLLLHLEQYAMRVATEPQVMARARETLVRLCGEGASESASRYARLQQAEAAGRVRDLRAALEEVRNLDRDRAGMLREVAHDLRGSVSVITNASAILARSTSEHTRLRFFQVLDRAIHSTQALLGDLLDLSRLEAGQEVLDVSEFDASALLRDLGDSMRALAAERGLFLKTEGPTTLTAYTDRAKLQRIVQNLILNALRATELGGVQVTWQPPIDDAPHWTICVADTGPGMALAQAMPLGRALQRATEQAHDTEERAARAEDPSARSSSAPTLPSGDSARTTRAPSGEGIGLSIVKRLCELMNASIELETAPGRGTTFRIRLPNRAPGTAPAEH
jgi:signal transduction histidine kinase